MNGVAKGMLIVLIILYVVSPIDFCPGPIDDLIVILLGIAAKKVLVVQKQRRCERMNLPSLGNIGNFLKSLGDYLKVERTKTDRIVATAKSGDVKLSKTVYPTGRVVKQSHTSQNKTRLFLPRKNLESFRENGWKTGYSH